ncbi:helix-turn-helix domain-containing protein [Bradyrhizobium sp. INPA01-394B]|uniref:Helix-turn-helix domain-containing protein n=1 Tax=Bradyrhizobium campsiandrae TaxID=1729892 RepID=A0ABR7U3F5_9BRAD|nr:helix-turn-helix domain-containing protein [Bradyrhizobium campsiandrae]MBC9879879.1 helix-turn-helix domain-containing protein [Bradyrhizobium campsiandrae]MBC9978564.1 helix-turn-helix domain-containing protein [Bradyrhizobium campsiandrae]
MLKMQNLEAVKDREGYDRWHQVSCRNYSYCEARRDSDYPFSAQISSWRFGALGFSDGRLSSDLTQLDRGPAEIRKDPRDHFMLYLVLLGGVCLTQDGREARAQSGDLFLYDQAQPFTLKFRQDYRAIMVNIPRPLLISRLPRARGLTARRIAGDSKLGALAGTIVRQITKFGEPADTHVIDRLGSSALDILATTMEAELAGPPEVGCARERLLTQVKSYILAHLHRSDLDIETIAKAQNIAPRTLNRLFAIDGTTPIRWLWEQRLLACYKALAEGHVCRVTDAAVSFGFTDMSHFSRAFKNSFGMSPHLIRRSRH